MRAVVSFCCWRRHRQKSAAKSVDEKDAVEKEAASPRHGGWFPTPWKKAPAKGSEPVDILATPEGEGIAEPQAPKTPVPARDAGGSPLLAFMSGGIGRFGRKAAGDEEAQGREARMRDVAAKVALKHREASQRSRDDSVAGTAGSAPWDPEESPGETYLDKFTCAALYML